jgi:septal ring factor EnvC (AmiA/AmiB activator)
MTKRERITAGGNSMSENEKNLQREYDLQARKSSALLASLNEANNLKAEFQAMYSAEKERADELEKKVTELENKLAAAGMPDDLAAEEGQPQPE